MSITSTKAIVLNSIKYSESSLIVKCFTEELGIVTFLVKGVLKSKKGKFKPAYFQPLTQLQLNTSSGIKSNLNSIKDIQVSYHYQTIYGSIIKQSIILFLSEVLTHSIKEEEPNIRLYNYLETALIWLDTHNKTANFHLLFLLNLTRYLGFYPDLSDSHLDVFNLLEGRFISHNDKFTISGNHLNTFRKLLRISFDEISAVSYNKMERQQVLQILIQYFELHLNGFKKPKSLTILESLFN